MSTQQDNNFLDYNLPQNAYTSFDAVDLKDFIIQRLNESNAFTDQNYEGSNLAAIIDIIAHSYHVLLFYLNNTAAESSFDQATLYENMNRIVKTIGYKPTGKQTSIASINATASDGLTVGNYTIRKYSYFLIDSIQYTFNRDYSFSITEQANQTIDSLSDSVILYQGTVEEYPDYTATGEEFETLTIVVDNILDNNDSSFIADNTISVYVKEIDTDQYYEYSEVENLYLSDNVSRSYEKRINENGHFVLKFGNGVAGRQLKQGNIVSVNYIRSNGTPGVISRNAINGNKLYTYDSLRQREIFEDTFVDADSTNFITTANSALLTFNNPAPSSPIVDEEGVEDIRKNAPAIFSQQLRLIRASDYENFILKRYPNIVSDVKVVDNNSFIREYIQYFYNICVDPAKTNRVLINQVNFSDSCDFNNVNVFAVPRFNITSDGEYPPFLSNSLKNFIVDVTSDQKCISHEVVPRDPIYMGFDIGYTSKSEVTTEISQDTILTIVRDSNDKINKEIIKSKVIATIKDFFDPIKNSLGGKVRLTTLASRILDIQGVRRLETRNTKEGVVVDNLSFVVYNALYGQADVSLLTTDTTLPFFKFPYLANPESIADKVQVVDE